VSIEPVRVSTTVPLAPERAFALFTEGIGTWWPLERHSVGAQAGKAAAGAVLEGGHGGEVYEVSDGGEHEPWGRVLVWDPPARLALTWHPGSDERVATEYEVRFTAVAQGARVDIEHGGWEARGGEAAEIRRSYSEEWPGVLEAYAKAARQAGAPPA
jgi:uncharacterized protein YndB with AHSA1/START domain